MFNMNERKHNDYKQFFCKNTECVSTQQLLAHNLISRNRRTIAVIFFFFFSCDTNNLLTTITQTTLKLHKTKNDSNNYSKLMISFDDNLTIVLYRYIPWSWIYKVHAWIASIGYGFLVLIEFDKTSFVVKQIMFWGKQ